MNAKPKPKPIITTETHDTITICVYCGAEATSGMYQRGCCGESSAHFEEHFYDVETYSFYDQVTGELFSDCGDWSRVPR